METPAIITAIVSLLTVIVTIIGAVSTIKKTRSDINVTVVEQARNWLEVQGVYIQQLQASETALRAEVHKQREKAESLDKRVCELEQSVAIRNNEIEKLKTAISNMRIYVSYLLDGVYALRTQVCNANLKPDFDPVSFDEFLERAG